MSPNQKTLLAAGVAFVTCIAIGAICALLFVLVDEKHDDWAVLAVFGCVAAPLFFGSAAWVALFKFTDSRPQPPVPGQAPPTSPGTPVS
ncbi:hypothetical protein OG547_30130 [Streptomyces longwoodensis]|uniref:hypothetical protein n=1 Tax=Streptomyces longwoodensis TaxID=68231 RepID=UPI002ED38048|nr:hypothetical protein OG547_30130 [Streptomyces longwoodensis]